MGRMPVYAASLEREEEACSTGVWGIFAPIPSSLDRARGGRWGAACGERGLTELDLLPAGLGDWGPATAGRAVQR